MATTTQMAITCPAGAAAGQMIQIQTPAGQTMQVQVPAGLTAGQQFHVTIPAVPSPVAPIAVATPAQQPAAVATVANPLVPMQMQVFETEAVDNEASLTCVVAKCTVRDALSTKSNVVRELQIGDTVQVLERDMFEGHQRVRIGKNEWASQVTAKGSELLVLSHLLTAESS